MEASTGYRPEKLNGPDLPVGAEYLWQWFLSLHFRRAAGIAGPMPIQWQEIDAWARLTRTDPLPWEIDVLLALDVAYIAQRIESKPTDETGGV